MAVQLALRDLTRYQARSGAALAAISLALGITVAIIISSAADKAAANAGNLPGTQIAWIGQAGGNRRLCLSARPASWGAWPPRCARSPVRSPRHRDHPGHARQPGRQAAARQQGSPRTVSSQPRRAANPAPPAAAGPTFGPPVCRDARGAPPAGDQSGGDQPGHRDPHHQAGSPVLSTITTFADAAHVQHIEAPGYTSRPLAYHPRRLWTAATGGRYSPAG